MHQKQSLYLVTKTTILGLLLKGTYKGFLYTKIRIKTAKICAVLKNKLSSEERYLVFVTVNFHDPGIFDPSIYSLQKNNISLYSPELLGYIHLYKTGC